MWLDRLNDLVAMSLSLVTDIIRYVMHCWLISPSNLNLIVWLLAYVYDKYNG